MYAYIWATSSFPDSIKKNVLLFEATFAFVLAIYDSRAFSSLSLAFDKPFSSFGFGFLFLVLVTSSVSAMSSFKLSYLLMELD